MINYLFCICVFYMLADRSSALMCYGVAAKRTEAIHVFRSTDAALRLRFRVKPIKARILLFLCAANPYVRW